MCPSLVLLEIRRATSEALQRGLEVPKEKLEISEQTILPLNRMQLKKRRRKRRGVSKQKENTRRHKQTAVTQYTPWRVLDRRWRGCPAEEKSERKRQEVRKEELT